MGLSINFSADTNKMFNAIIDGDESIWNDIPFSDLDYFSANFIGRDKELMRRKYNINDHFCKRFKRFMEYQLIDNILLK